MRKSTRLLKEVDPNLNVISAGGRRRRRTTQADWDKAEGKKCPTCGGEIFRTHGPFEQCLKCLYKEKGTFIEETECRKCKARAVKVQHLSDGLEDVKIVCPDCGTYEDKGDASNRGN